MKEKVMFFGFGLIVGVLALILIAKNTDWFYDKKTGSGGGMGGGEGEEDPEDTDGADQGESQ